MIFEYSPSSFSLDIKRLEDVISFFKVKKILIPQSPNFTTSSNSFCSCVFYKQIFKHIEFIPTLKGSELTYESFYSFLLSARYFNIKSIALISGDSKANLSSIDMLKILKSFSKKYDFKIDPICASSSLLDKSTLKDLELKLSLEASTFITQPFYSLEDARAFSTKVSFLKARFYLGFMPLKAPKDAININNKKLGIKITQSYINDIDSNFLATNKALFASLKDSFNLSIGYIRYSDIDEIFYKK